MAGIYETDDEEGGQAPLVPLPTSRRPSRIAVAQYLSLAAGVVLVLAGLLMTLRDECPPGTVKIVRGAIVVDDAAGTLSIASFVSPLLSLSARSSLECTPRMTVEEEAAEAERVRQHERATSAATNAGRLDLLKEWLEQYEQRVRPSGEHDIVRMPARDFVGSDALPGNGDDMFTAQALVQSLPSWFRAGYDVRHLGRLVHEH